MNTTTAPGAPTGRSICDLLGENGSGEAVLDCLGAIVWLADATDLSVLFLNRKASALLGPSRDDAQQPPGVLGWVHGDDRARLLDACRAVAATGASRPIDYRVMDRRGRLVPLSGQVHAARAEADEARVALAFVGLAAPGAEPAASPEGPTDALVPHGGVAGNSRGPASTTEPLSAERAARLTQIEEIFDNVDGIVWEVDADTFRFTYVSAQAEHILGYPVSRWIREPTFWVDHIHPDDRRWCMSLCKASSARGEPHRFEYRMIAADGRIVWLRDYVRVLLEDGRPARLRGVMVDITEWKQVQEERDRLLVEERRLRAEAECARGRMAVLAREAQEALRRKEESLALLDTLLMTAPVGLAFLDQDLRYVRTNRALATGIHGLSPEEEQGLTVREATPALAPTIEPYIRSVLDSGKPLVGVEVSGPSAAESGQVKSWLASYYPVRTAQGDVLGVGAVVVDVTEHKRAEEVRAQLYREAQEAIRVRDDFLSIASHELKTPLTTLTLRLEQMLRRVRAGQPVDGALVGVALTQVGRLTALTNDLLDVSRIGAGRLTIRRESVSLGDLVREAVASVGVSSDKHVIDLTEPREEVVVAGDRGRLLQVLANLLDNAVKYTPRGGTIRVSLSRRDGEAVLSVADPGIGIPREQQGMLFERFFRARNAPISSYGGLGLGLYICRDIVERHGGRIWVESDVGRGSAFKVALPIDAR